MILDIAIVIFLVSSFFRGREIGFIRQACSSVGFFGGLFVGSAIQPYTIGLAHTTSTKALVTVATTLLTALLLLVVGEYIGIALKRRVLEKPINVFDNSLGGGLSIVSFLLTIWIAASLISGLPLLSVQHVIRNSQIISKLNRSLPPAPDVIAGLGKLIDPNGFPNVFIGGEPNSAQRSVTLPDLGVLQTAVANDKASVVKIEGQGCGGVVEGSGFVIGKDLIATNAHVVAGISKPYVQDILGTHSAKVIWFNPNLDFAILRTSNIAGKTLELNTAIAKVGTPAAVLGYPGGGVFSPKAAAVVDSFIARGRNIYGKGVTSREVYELKAEIIPGNSGGPVVIADGSVIGVVFAQSTTYNHVGYALTASQITADLARAQTQNRVVGTGSCAE